MCRRATGIGLRSSKTVVLFPSRLGLATGTCPPFRLFRRWWTRQTCKRHRQVMPGQCRRKDMKLIQELTSNQRRYPAAFTMAATTAVTTSRV
eukprot:2629148-Pyramimonas_sp.AAC.1